MVDDPSKIHKQFYLSNVKKYLNYIIFTIYCEKKATSIDKKNPVMTQVGSTIKLMTDKFGLKYLLLYFFDTRKMTCPT